MKKVGEAFLIFLLLFLPFFSYAGVLHFEHADVIYPEGYLDVAVRVGNIFESVRQNVVSLIGYDPGRISIVLQDKGTISNGYTQVVLHKTIVLYTWPTEGYMGFYLPLEDWYTYLIIHEFTHMCHLSYQDELGKFISILVGVPYLPQLSSPFVEGTTVFAESAFSLSSGRLNNPFFSSGLYYYSLPNFPSLSYKETTPQDDYRGGTLYYNFTAGFYKYLVDTYGLDSVKKFLNITSQTVLPMLLPYATETTITDPYEYVFGKKLDELYTDWIMSLTKLNYQQGKLVFNLRNSLIIRVDSHKNEIAVLRQSFGPTTSYVGTFENGLIFLDDVQYKKVDELPLNSHEVKFDGTVVYALQTSNFLDKFENKLWNITENKVIASGYITSFGVYSGEVYVSYYDTKTLTSKIKLLNGDFEYDYNGYVKNLDVSKDAIAFLTLDNRIIVLDKNGNEIAKIDDRNMKGPYVKVQDKKVLFSRVEGEYIIPYYYDMENKLFYKLADKTILSDFTIHKDELYYVSYTPYGNTGGNGIYKTKIQLQELQRLPNENPSTNISITEHQYKQGNEHLFRLATFLTPVTWVPMYTNLQLENDNVIHTFYLIFTFTNVENDTAFVLTPILDVIQTDPNTLDFSVLGYRQFFGFFTSKDYFGLSASYMYPTNDYSFSAGFILGEFTISPATSLYTILGTNLKSKKDYNLDSIFGLLGSVSVPSIDLATLSLGIYIPTNILSKPVRMKNWVILSNDDYAKLFSLESMYLASSLLVGLNLDSSLLAVIQTNISKPEKTYYDLSFAYTLFKDSAELFGGQLLIRNSGLTFGLANPENIHGVYSHFFVETYFGGVKAYPSIGAFIQLMDLYGLPSPSFNGFVYFGIGSSPHALNSLYAIPF
ncbi:MAG: hypothetical protein ACP5KD_08645 [Fervidobacterium sp.]